MTDTIDPLEMSIYDIIESSEPIPFSKLYAFSDLSRERLDRFRAIWDRLATQQRQRILSRMVELTEASFQVSFGAVFRHCLDDRDKVIRTTAVEGLWEDEHPDLIGPFIRMLRNDSSSSVRAAAAAGLGRFVLAGELEKLEPAIQQRIITELLTVLHTADETLQVRCRAIESVAYACSDRIGDALELAYDHEEEAMQRSALIGMGRSCDRRWQPVILQELQNPSPSMRYEAALASGELGLRQAVPALGRLLQDADREVVMASIWALGQIGGQQAKEALIAAYDDADDDERRELDDALAEHALASGEIEFDLYGPDSLDQILGPYDLRDIDELADDDMQDDGLTGDDELLDDDFEAWGPGD